MACCPRLHHIELDQNNHKNSILLSGIPERKKEEGSTTSTPEDTNKVVLDMASEKLGIDLTEQDIDHSHRSKNALPGRKRGAARPIYVKFTKYSIRKKIMMPRKKTQRYRYGATRLSCLWQSSTIETGTGTGLHL